MRRLAPAVLLPFLLASCAAHEPARAAAPIADRGVVVAPEPIAARVGAEVLRRGGNAVDASVAVAFTLAVTFPNAGNLGGGGFMLVHRPDGEDAAVDYRETAPAAATETMFQDADGRVRAGESLHTHRAAGVPGTVAGLWLAHERFGSLPWADLVAPAIRLAEEGFVVDADLAQSLHGAEVQVDRFFPGGIPEAGDVWRQPDLAATLRRIAERGAAGFYEGETARLFEEEMRRGGGLVTEEDLAAYRAVVRRPLVGRYRDLTIVTMPPPSSGGVAMLQIFGMLERFPAPEAGRAVYYHLVAEIEKRVFADRSEYLGDPDVVGVPVERLLDPAYLAARAAEIHPARKTDPAAVRPGLAEGEHTTHLTVADRWGGVVANTYTLNDSYGCGIVVGGAGFLLNNEMDDFSAAPGSPNLYGVTGSRANAIAPGKRMLSSMSPTFVYRDGRLWLALGTPGGPTIFTTVFQVIQNRAVFGMTLEDAVAAPRFHHQWPAGERDAISVEAGVGEDARAALRAMGYEIRERRLGDVQAVEWADGVWLAAPDPRGHGAAAFE